MWYNLQLLANVKQCTLRAWLNSNEHTIITPNAHRYTTYTNIHTDPQIYTYIHIHSQRYTNIHIHTQRYTIIHKYTEIKTIEKPQLQFRTIYLFLFYKPFTCALTRDSALSTRRFKSARIRIFILSLNWIHITVFQAFILLRKVGSLSLTSVFSLCGIMLLVYDAIPVIRRSDVDFTELSRHWH